jgi:sigma-B regulation protein RsbU (phosphoserine phosphatase)
MTPQHVLLVSDPCTAARQVREALDAEGIPTTVLPAGSLADELPSGLTNADVLLVNASLAPESVRELGYRVEQRTGTLPVGVAFPEGDIDSLEPHVLAGGDFLLPPYLPVLVHRRISDCHERHRMSVRLDAAETAGHLLEYERELQIGQEIQRGFLPESIPRPPGWEIDVRFRPAREVAGDFYDAFELVAGRRIGFIVADVCDKGVGAALFMALIRSLLRHTACHTGSLNVVGMDVRWAERRDGLTEQPVAGATTAGVVPLLSAVDGANSYLVANHLSQGYFATLFFGVLDPATGNVVYINCGHNPPVLLRKDGTRLGLPPTGPALGMLPGSTFRLGQARLDPGDTLFVYTDGVTEARDATGQFFTEDRMNVVLSGLSSGASAAVGAVDDSVRDFVGSAEQFDDITMMALHRQVEVEVPVAEVEPKTAVIRTG